MDIARSARLYQERRQPQFLPTLRSPGPRLNMSDNLVHRIPLEPPLPLPEVLAEALPQTPDSAHTQPWPHGSRELV